MSRKFPHSQPQMNKKVQIFWISLLVPQVCVVMSHDSQQAANSSLILWSLCSKYFFFMDKSPYWFNFSSFFIHRALTLCCWKKQSNFSSELGKSSSKIGQRSNTLSCPAKSIINSILCFFFFCSCFSPFFCVCLFLCFVSKNTHFLSKLCVFYRKWMVFFLLMWFLLMMSTRNYLLHNVALTYFYVWL